jgi:Cupin-like domain
MAAHFTRAEQEDLLNRLPAVPVASLTTASDLDQAVAAARPLVINGLFERWPALAAGRESPTALNRYLKAMDRGLLGTVMEAPASTGGRFGYSADMREFTFSKRQQGISETLDRIERQLDRPHASVIAFQMLPLATHLPEFIAQNPMPLLPHTAPLLWLGGRVRTQIHHDRDHNLACVLAGRRRFVLFPPEQVANLYVGPIDHPPPLSIVDAEAPDFARFPRFAEALKSAQVAELGAGDAIFMPRHWWHHVTSRDSYNAMVNYWWGAHAPGIENPYDCFLTALLALKDLPAAERIYWQAMFDTYVFQSGGSAIEHIPPDLQGVLGTGRPGIRAALKQKLKAAFLKS